MSKKGFLLLCGAGINNPEDLTVGTIAMLKQCDQTFAYAFSEGARRNLFDLLGLLIKPIDERAKEDIPREERASILWKALYPRLRRGERIAYIDYGHPMLFGISQLLIKKCRSSRFSYRVLPAISSIDTLLAQLDKNDTLEDGFVVSGTAALAKHKDLLNSSLPKLVFCVGQAVQNGVFASFCKQLRLAYGKKHLYMVQSSTNGKPSCSRLSAKKLESVRALDRATLLIPGKKKTRLR